MVFQSYSLFPNMSAFDNVGFGLRMRKIGAGASVAVSLPAQPVLVAARRVS